MRHAPILIALISLSIELRAQAPVITSANPPVVQQGQTFQFTATGGGITWSVSGAGCSGSPCGSINSGSGLYTAPATVTPKHSLGGCQIFDNGMIYNVNTSAQSTDASSATWIALSGLAGANALSFQGGIPWLNFNDGTAPTLSVTPTSGQSGNYTVMSVPFTPTAAMQSYWTYYYTGTSVQDQHSGTVQPGNCNMTQLNGLSTTSTWTIGASYVGGGANQTSTYSSVLPVNQGVDAGGDWMFALDLQPAELNTAVAISATDLGHMLRTTLSNGVICGSSTANACGENAGGTRHIWPSTSEAFLGGGSIPYGAVLRLKSTVNCSTKFTGKPAEIIVCNTLKNYGALVTDGTDPTDSMALGIGYGFTPYSLADINTGGGSLPLSNFEFVNIQSLLQSSTTGATTLQDKVTATNGSGSASQFVTLIGPTLGLPYPGNILITQATTPPFQLAAFVNGTTNTGVTWTIPTSPSIQAEISPVSNTSGGSSATSAPQINAVSGDFIVVDVDNAAACGAPTSVTDTAGNAYTHRAAADSGNLTRWDSIGITANSADVVTAHWSASCNFMAVDVREYNPGGSTISLDVTATGSTGAGSPVTSGNFTTTGTNEVIIASADLGQSQSLTAGTIAGQTGTNFIGSSNFSGSNDLIVAAIQTGVNASFTFGGSSASISVVSYKGTGGSPTGGAVTSGGLYTPPKSLIAASSSVVTATAAANASAVGLLYVTNLPAGTIRLILNGNCAVTAPSFNVTSSPGCSSAPYIDGSGNAWQGQPVGLNLVLNNCGAFSPNSGDPQLFELPGSSGGSGGTFGDTVFPFHVPNGVYSVSLNFMVGSCAYNTSSRQQLETIEIQGTPVLKGLDVAALAGSKNPLTETFSNVVVSNGLLYIALRTTGNNPVGSWISSMSIMQTSSVVPNQNAGHLP